MYSSKRSFAVTIMFVLSVGSFGLSVWAQHSGHGEVAMPERPYIEKLRLNKDGQVKLSTDARVGDAALKRGKYKFEHVVEGEEHFIAFRRVDESAVEAREQVIRVKCRLEPLNKPAKHTELYSTVTGRGERTIERAQVQGESVKHVF